MTCYTETGFSTVHGNHFGIGIITSVDTSITPVLLAAMVYRLSGIGTGILKRPNTTWDMKSMHGKIKQ